MRSVFKPFKFTQGNDVFTMHKKLGKCFLMGACGLAVAGSTAVYADTYIGELSARAGYVDGDGDNDTQYLGGSASLFLEPVNTAGQPLAEAAFMNRATNFYIYDTYSDVNDDKGHDYGIGGEVYFPHSMFYAAANYNRSDRDGSDNDTWRLTGGITPVAGLLITTTYVEDVGYDLNLNTKYMLQLPGAQSLLLQAGFYDDDVNTLNAGFDFFLNNYSSVGMSISDHGSDTDYSFRGKHFFNTRFYLGGAYTSTDTSDEISVNLGYRF